MIRMGRGNRPEPEPQNDYTRQTTATPNYSYPTETTSAATPANRAVTESDSMARDIKEGRLSGFV